MATYNVSVTHTLSLSDRDKEMDRDVRDQIVFTDFPLYKSKHILDLITFAQTLGNNHKSGSLQDVLTFTNLPKVNRSLQNVFDVLIISPNIKVTGGNDAIVNAQNLVFSQIIGVTFTKHEAITQVLVLSSNLSSDRLKHGGIVADFREFSYSPR